MSLKAFRIPFGENILMGNTYKKGADTIILHGAGQSDKDRFTRLRGAFHAQGIPSVGFDFIGHGETGGRLLGSTLHQRTDQAAEVIRCQCSEPLTLVGVSMSGHTAIKLTEIFNVRNLILMVPAVYTADAYDIPFGPAFSKTIRQNESWRSSDAFGILQNFNGRLLVIAAESDAVIPSDVIEGIYSSAQNAESRHVHVVPGSKHSPLFPKDQDFSVAFEKILAVCKP